MQVPTIASPDREEAALAGALSSFITVAPEEDAAFSTLACRLFTYQYERNVPYQRFCRAQGITPAQVSHWSQIPPAPAAAFKQFDLSCTSPEAAARVFWSSGTTGRAASRHYLTSAALAVYDRSLRAGFTRFVQPDGASLPLWALAPSPALEPHSSLSYMFQSLMEASPAHDHRYFWGETGPDCDALAAALRSVAQPVILFGTAFAWVIFFDNVTEHFTLPPGTRVLETGGFKGRSRSIPRETLYELFQERLGIPRTHCLAEYGMSEMCAQFYDSTLVDYHAGRTLPMRKLAPPWARTRILNPLTGDAVAPGEAGLLCHYDLSNLNSVLAICTEDLGRQVEDGFELLGRAPQAALRGCSLTAEEWHARA